MPARKKTDEVAKMNKETDAQEAGAWRNGRNRSEKSELIRTALLKAAAEVVGEVGYAEASVTRITQKAGVAQGTFYNYFETRQDILDALLPALGANMQRHIKNSAGGGHSFAELEKSGFLAFFSFLEQEPHFFRILNEAESFAPKGHKAHFDAVVRQYMHFLEHSHRQGQFPRFELEELEPIVLILMAARSYLAMRYAYGDNQHKELPPHIAESYLKFVRYGLEGVPPDQNKPKNKKQ